MVEVKRDSQYPLAEIDSDLPLQISLRQLMAEQTTDLQENIESIPKDTDNFEKIRTWFKESERFAQIYQEAQRLLLAPKTDEEEEEVNYLRKHLNGAVYQHIASRFIARQKHPEKVVLYPERTLNFYSELYPHAKRVKNPFRLDSLKNISVPDGLIIEKNGDKAQITAVCEYTIRTEREQEYFWTKYNTFCIDKEHEKVFADASLLFVLPSKCEPAVANLVDVDILPMPFSHRQFKKFSKYIFSKYRPEVGDNCATLAEIQEFIGSRKDVSLKYLEDEKGYGY